MKDYGQKQLNERERALSFSLTDVHTVVTSAGWKMSMAMHILQSQRTDAISAAGSLSGNISRLGGVDLAMTNEEGVAAMTSGQGRRPHTHGRGSTRTTTLAHLTRSTHTKTRHCWQSLHITPGEHGNHRPDEVDTLRTLARRLALCLAPHEALLFLPRGTQHSHTRSGLRHRTHSRQELQENAHYPHTVTKRCLTNLTWIGRAPKASYIKQSHNPKKHNPTFTH